MVDPNSVRFVPDDDIRKIFSRVGATRAIQAGLMCQLKSTLEQCSNPKSKINYVLVLLNLKQEDCNYCNLHLYTFVFDRLPTNKIKRSK